MVKRRAIVLAAVALFAIGSARAADRTVNASINGPVSTSNASNGPGKISIGTSGTISLNSSTDATVTLDSSDIVTNQGTIINSAPTNAVGVHVVSGDSNGSFTNSYSSTGTLYVDSGDGTGNVGILVDGPTAWDGGILLDVGSLMDVTGVGASAIQINAPINYSITNNGTITTYDQGAHGIVVAAPVAQFILNEGSIANYGTLTYDQTKIDPEPGYTIGIGANVGLGILNSGPVNSSDTATPTGSITNIGSQPALYISPTVAGANAADIVISPFPDSTVPGFDLLNRGTIQDDGNDPGVNAQGAVIEGDGTYGVTLAEGIYNQGLIRASATSDNYTASSVPAAASNATALTLGDGAYVGRLVNPGTINGYTQGAKGGIGIGLLIEPGATLPILDNTGYLTGVSLTTDSSVTGLEARAVEDLSGTLTTVTNSGHITVTGSATDTPPTLVALDLSHATTTTTVTNSGDIEGNVLFGSGDNTFVIDGDGANMIGRVYAASGGTLQVNVLNGSLKSDQVNATDIQVGDNGVVAFALARSTSAAPLISATNDITFNAGARVQLTPTTFLPDNGSYTLISAGGTLTFDDKNATISDPIPFLFNGSYTTDNHNLYLNLQRKTAAQLGLAGNQARIYQPAMQAAQTDDFLGAALLTLGNTQEVQDTMAALLPATSVGVRNLTIAVTNQNTGPIGTRLRKLVTSDRDGLQFWSQQFYEDLNGSTVPTSPSYFGSGLGISVGAEWGQHDMARYGVGYTYFAGQVTENHPRASKADVTLQMLSFYGGLHFQDFFLTPQANIGIAQFSGRRSLFVHNLLSRTAAANWFAYLASAGVTSGYVLHFGPVDVMPQISISGVYLHQNAYDETGGNGIDLHVGQQDDRSVLLFAGVVAQSHFSFDAGTVYPQVLAGWTRELATSNQVIDASFEALPGSPFALVGPKSDPSKVVGGASMDYVFANWSAGVNYDAQKSSGTFAQSATVTLTSRF